MKRILVFSVLIFLTGLTFAKKPLPELKVAVAHFEPPFVVRAGNGSFYGFDVSLMDYVCQQLQRKCTYLPMRRDQLIHAISEGEADVAISALILNDNDTKIVNFSDPYLPSKSHFLGKSELSAQTFTLELVNSKRVGIEKGTVFQNQIDLMGAQDVKITSFVRGEDMIDALSNGEIDLVLTDAETTLYWENNSGGMLKVVGPVFAHGFGYAMATNKTNNLLLQQINASLKKFIDTEAFKKNYEMYLQS